jgi:hypothetical protein
MLDQYNLVMGGIEERGNSIKTTVKVVVDDIFKHATTMEVNWKVPTSEFVKRR